MTDPDSPNIIYVDSISDRHITLKWSGIPCEGCHVDFYNVDKMSDAGEALHTEGITCPSSANGNEKVCLKTFKKLHPGHFYTFAVTAVSGGLRSQRPYVFQQRTSKFAMCAITVVSNCHYLTTPQRSTFFALWAPFRESKVI